MSILAKDPLFELIFDGNYEEAISLLEGAKEFRGLNRNDNNILIVLKDLVSIMESRPMSKTKRWILTAVVNKA